ncbi:MAG TPA: GTP cyclohydrolase I [Hyphomicrobiaceae bacterium]|nr:GTP cyclohydrolase I [Hyphomicrobiaceae bacterium]
MSQLKTIATLPAQSSKPPARPSRQEAERAVQTLLAWAGEDPERDGLLDTPRRVVEAYEEYFRGYREDPLAWLDDDDTDMARGYDDMIMLRGIHIQSFCEHHLTPFEGVIHLAYLPGTKVVGLSRLARVVETLAHRLQTQEALTEQIGNILESGLRPLGIAILMEAEHQCMSLRGVRQRGVKTITTRFTGAFNDDAPLRDRFIILSRDGSVMSPG